MHPSLTIRSKAQKPNKLIHPLGKISPLFSESDERFPSGSEETYIRDDRLQILKILGMKCDSLSWTELVERAESVSKIPQYELAVERSIAILGLLNEMLNTSGPTSVQVPCREEKESKCKACEVIRDIAFIPVKPKPYQKLGLTWHGDKFKYRFAKPKELISAQYENICSTLWPVPLNEFKKKENIMTKQIELFLGLMI